MNAVVVDDSAAMRRIVGRMLQRAGFEDVVCHEATSGREAFSLIRRVQPDIVLSDLHMPDGDGLELLAKLRGARCAVPFGLITADAGQPLRTAALEAGAQFLLAKPFEPAALREAIDAALVASVPAHPTVAPRWNAAGEVAKLS